MTPKRVGSTIAHRGIQRPKAPQFKKAQRPTTTTGLGSFNPFKWFTWFDPPPEQRKAPSVALEKKQKKQNDKQPRPTINNSNQKVKTAPPSPPKAFEFNFWKIVQIDLFGQQEALTGDVSPRRASDERHSSDDSSTITDDKSDRTSNTSKKTTTRSQSSEASSQKTDRPPFEAPLNRKWRELLRARIERGEDLQDPKKRNNELTRAASTHCRVAGHPRLVEDQDDLDRAHNKLIKQQRKTRLERPYNGAPPKRQRHQ